MEHNIFHEMMSHFDSNQLIAFFKNSVIFSTVEEIARSLDKGQQTDLIIMDFSNLLIPFRVPYQRVLMKLRYYGIRCSFLTPG